MSTPFWQDYDNTVEICVVSTVEASFSYGAVDHPEAEQIFGGVSVATHDAFSDVSGVSGVVDLVGSNQIFGTPYGSDAGLDNILLEESANQSDVGNPTSDLDDRWAPDSVDFFIQFGNFVGVTITSSSSVVRGSYGVGSPGITVTITDQGGGLYRVRVTTLEDLTWNWDSSGATYGTAYDAFQDSGLYSGNPNFELLVTFAVDGVDTFDFNLAWQLTAFGA